MSERVIPASWLSDCKMSAVVLHWTGGAHSCSELDKEHYHIIIDGKSNLHRGDNSISDNARPLKKGYAAHARNFNAGSIGVSLCGMAGARESPFYMGPFPIRKEQWEKAARVVAELCDEYNIPVTMKTVLQHGEIQKNTGVEQKGKWDVCKLPWRLQADSEEVCREFRLMVISWLLSWGRKDLVLKANGGTK